MMNVEFKAKVINVTCKYNRVVISTKLSYEGNFVNNDTVELRFRGKHAIGVIQDIKEYYNNIIYLSHSIASTLGVKLNEDITMKKIKLSNAERIIVVTDKDINEKNLKKLLRGYRLCNGQLVDLSTRNGSIQCKVISTYPTGAVEVVDSTEVIKRDSVQISNITYAEIGGLKKYIEELKVYEYMLKNYMYCKHPKGIIICGPSGVGKSLLARAFINESNIHAIQIPAKSLPSESCENMSAIFSKAKESRPSIIFIDNIEILARKVDNSIEHERSKIIKAFAEEIDNLPAGVLILATTDDIQIIDSSVRRSGRMDTVIELPLPDDNAREEIIKIQAAILNVSIEDTVIKRIAELTHGYTGADLLKLLTNAIKRCVEKSNCRIDERLRLTLDDFVIDREKTEYNISIPKIRFEDVGGMSHVKDIIKRDIITILKYRKVIKESGIDIKIPKGILFYGPPGTGKTLLAKAIANEIGMNIMVVNASTILSKWLGESEHNIKRLFDTARRNAPTMIVLDEIDAIGSKRSSSGDSGSDARASILNELLTQIDGIKNSDDILIVGTTNRRDRLDEALIRSGRLEIHLEIPKPTLNDRIDIFRIHTRDIKLDVDIEELARIMEDSTGADIEFIVKKAKSIWLNELVNTMPESMLEDALRNTPINKEHFMRAIKEYRK